MVQQIEQFGFECGINFAAAPRLGRIGQPVEATLLPLVEPAAHGFGMHLVQQGELFQAKTFGRKQNRLCSLPQPMDGTVPMNLFQRRPLGVRKSRHKLGTRLHAEILPESKIPGYLCTTT